VVVQADELLDLSTVIVAPTSRSATPATFRPAIDLDGTPTRVLTDQIRVIDTRAVKASLGHLSHGEMAAVDDALSLILGLAG
jgi:mRNA interferase MazF